MRLYQSYLSLVPFQGEFFAVLTKFLAAQPQAMKLTFKTKSGFFKSFRNMKTQENKGMHELQFFNLSTFDLEKLDPIEKSDSKRSPEKTCLRFFSLKTNRKALPDIKVKIHTVRNHNIEEESDEYMSNGSSKGKNY